MDAEIRRARRRLLLRVGLAATVLLAVFVAARIAGLTPSVDRIKRFGDDLGPFGPAVFVLGGVALNLVFVPIPVIAGAAGLVFGTAEGTAIGVLVVGGAAATQLLIGRRLTGEHAPALFGSRATSVMDFISRRGFLAVLYLRLIPGIPFNTLNYAAGLSRLRARDMFAGTALGFAPRIFAFAALGGSIGNLDSTEARVAVALGVAMAVAGVLLARAQIAAERRRT